MCTQKPQHGRGTGGKRNHSLLLKDQPRKDGHISSQTPSHQGRCLGRPSSPNTALLPLFNGIAWEASKTAWEFFGGPGVLNSGTCTV
jgi:hypothetical protein